MREYYKGIDYLRVFACVAIIMMHMLSGDNNAYELEGVIFEKVIPSFSDLTFLFMVISAFVMCNGYYSDFLAGSVDIKKFYVRRYARILPFFSLLVIIDLLRNFSISSLYEAIADTSLLFGLFPNNITVIGVGWFLGLIFAFYLIFPFYCVLLSRKTMAWSSFLFSLLLNYVLTVYFGVGRNNIVSSLCFFLAGGIVFLYRDSIMRVPRHLLWIGLLISLLAYYMIGTNTITQMCVSVSLLMLALLGKRWHAYKPIAILSSVSMEMYLSHMMIFRLIELLGVNTLAGNGLFQYLITVVIVLVGTVAFSVIAQKIIGRTSTLLMVRK